MNSMYDNYRIPVNFTDAGRLFGLFPVRNAVEALVITVPVIIACFIFLPFAFTTRIMIVCIAAVPLGGFSLMGIRDDSLTKFLLTWIIWLMKRRIITFRGSPADQKQKRRDRH